MRHWVIQQIESGRTPESVLESMIANGWPEGAALDVMERTLRTRVAQIRAAENAGRAAADATAPMDAAAAATKDGTPPQPADETSRAG